MNTVLEAREPSARYLAALEPPLLQQFDLIASAPKGVAQLRELILMLAVQGKLVAQNPNDEPASVLLERIRDEKARLVKEGKIKKDKPLAEIAGEEKPFELPVGWEIIRFGTVAEIERGGSPRPIKDYITTDPSGFNWIKIGDTDKGGKYITSANEKIRGEGLSKTRRVFPGDFLLTNSMSFGRPYITKIEGCIHDGWLRISPTESLNKDFLYTLLSSPFVRRLFESAAAGAVVLNLNADKVREIPIPLPPLAEQSRIVARVEELMALCDALEAKGKLEAEQHARLIGSLFESLANSESAHALAENWQHIATHFDLLLDRPAAVDALEQSILQLAVRGLLVPQDPADEPASTLLQKIHAEKDRLIATGKLKRDKSLPQIADEEKPFQLPLGWEWVRLGDIWDSSFYGPRFSNDEYVSEGGIPTIRTTDMSDGQIVLKNAPLVRVPQDKYQSYLVSKGDILVTRSGSIGVMALFDLDVQAIPSAYLIRLRFSRYLSPYFCLKFFLSSLGQEQLGLGTTSVGVPNISASKMATFLFPLPPRNEQSRIVDRVAELRALCANLRQRLISVQQTQSRLAEALVESVVV